MILALVNPGAAPCTLTVENAYGAGIAPLCAGGGRTPRRSLATLRQCRLVRPFGDLRPTRLPAPFCRPCRNRAAQHERSGSLQRGLRRARMPPGAGAEFGPVGSRGVLGQRGRRRQSAGREAYATGGAGWRRRDRIASSDTGQLFAGSNRFGLAGVGQCQCEREARCMQSSCPSARQTRVAAGQARSPPHPSQHRKV